MAAVGLLSAISLFGATAFEKDGVLYMTETKYNNELGTTIETGNVLVTTFYDDYSSGTNKSFKKNIQVKFQYLHL